MAASWVCARKVSWTRPSPACVEPLKRRRSDNLENALRFFTFINYIGWKFFINTLKQLPKLRPLRPSVMFSTSPVAPKSCDCNWFFVFARDCRHRTQIPLIFGEIELIYYFLIPLEQTSLNVAKRTRLVLAKAPQPQIDYAFCIYLVISQSFTFLSFFSSNVGRNSNICEYFNLSVSHAINKLNEVFEQVSDVKMFAKILKTRETWK